MTISPSLLYFAETRDLEVLIMALTSVYCVVLLLVGVISACEPPDCDNPDCGTCCKH